MWLPQCTEVPPLINDLPLFFNYVWAKSHYRQTFQQSRQYLYICMVWLSNASMLSFQWNDVANALKIETVCNMEIIWNFFSIWHKFICVADIVASHLFPDPFSGLPLSASFAVTYHSRLLFPAGFWVVLASGRCRQRAGGLRGSQIPLLLILCLGLPLWQRLPSFWGSSCCGIAPPSLHSPRSCHAILCWDSVSH